MANESHPQVLRLRKKHQPGRHETPDAADGARLVQAQSLRQALMAGVIAAVLFAVIWSLLTSLVGVVWPWLSLLLGFMVGLAVRRAGQGFDWRFPVLAAVLAFIGAIVGKIVIAAGTTAAELGSSTLVVLRSVTVMTWPYFFAEVVTSADWVFALFAAGIAAFYANRRLNRREYQAVRIWRDKKDKSEQGEKH